MSWGTCVEVKEPTCELMKREKLQGPKDSPLSDRLFHLAFLAQTLCLSLSDLVSSQKLINHYDKTL